MKNKTSIKLKILAASVISALLLSGCDYLVENAYDQTENNLGIVSEAIAENASADNNIDNSESKIYEATVPEVTSAEEIITDAVVTDTPATDIFETKTENIKAEVPPFKASDIPEYSGSPYVEINNNVPFFTDHPDNSFAIYSPLDNLGRCGVAYANISTDLSCRRKNAVRSVLSDHPDGTR